MRIAITHCPTKGAVQVTAAPAAVLWHRDNVKQIDRSQEVIVEIDRLRYASNRLCHLRTPSQFRILQIHHDF